MIAALLTAAALSGGAEAQPAARTSAAGRGTAVGIGLSEYEVALYRPRVPAGKVRFNITNLGEDGHDFAVRTSAGVVRKRTEEILAGGRTTMRISMSRGTFTLVCLLPEHEERGMLTRLRVYRAQR